MTQDDIDAALARLRQAKSAPSTDPDHALAALRASAPKPTGHAGKPFVNAPEMANTHNGKAFFDAEPETTYGEEAGGRAASLGRYVGDDMQSAARAITHHPIRSVVDVVKELRNTKGSDVLKAMKFGGPMAVGQLTSDAMKRTSSYAQAHDEIRQAEDRVDPSVRNTLAAVGAAAQVAPLVQGGAGLARTALLNPKLSLMADAALSLSPIGGGGARSRLFERAVGVARRIASEAGTPVAPVAAPSEATPALEEVIAKVRRMSFNPKVPAAKVRMLDFDPKAPTAPKPSVVEAVKAWRQSHRTQASFRDMAERMGEPPRPSSLEASGFEGVENTPVAPRSKPALDAQLQEMWTKAKKLHPGEVDPRVGDAEVAMGRAPEQQQAIVDQVKPHTPNMLAYLQARMRNPSLPRVPTPEVLRSLGIEAAEAPSGVVRTPPTVKPIKSTAAPAQTGTLPRNLKHFTDDELEQRYHSLAERLGQEESANSAIQESGYRANYEELPRTEKLGRKGQEDLPDADGMVDAERLQGDNKAVSAYNRRTMVRAAQEKSLKRLADEIAARGKDFGSGVVPFSALVMAGGATANYSRR